MLDIKPILTLKKAQQGKYAIGQFNISTDEQLKAIIEVVKDFDSPVIIGTSEKERKFIGVNQIVALVKSWQKQTGLPIILNADHCKTFESIKEVVDAGYSAVHIDGSELLFKENIELTKKVVDYAKSKDFNILVEGELGYLRGGSDIHKEKTEIQEKDLTNVEQAKEFVEKTGIDSLAVVVGNIHGIESGMKNPPLFLNRLQEIQKTIPNVFLVLHGGSGTSEQDIKKAIELGVVKININTELRVAYTDALEQEIKEHPDEVRPYNVLAPAVKEVKKVVKEKIELFGSKDRL